MTETLPFSEAKAHLSDLADRVERSSAIPSWRIPSAARVRRAQRAGPPPLNGLDGPYALRITAEGRRHLDRLPERICSAVLAFAFEALA